jgi:sulfur carrier protein
MTNNAAAAYSITVNGNPTKVSSGANINDVVLTALDGASTAGVAVAVDGTVVPKSLWLSTNVTPDAVVELVTATQGG